MNDKDLWRISRKDTILGNKKCVWQAGQRGIGVMAEGHLETIMDTRKH